MALKDWFGSRKEPFAQTQERVREEVRERLPEPKPIGIKRVEEIMGRSWLPDPFEIAGADGAAGADVGGG